MSKILDVAIQDFVVRVLGAQDLCTPQKDCLSCSPKLE
jgi:hypothetical protein